MKNKEAGTAFLAYVLEHLKRRIGEINQSLTEGQKEIEEMQSILDSKAGIKK